MSQHFLKSFVIYQNKKGTLVEFLMENKLIAVACITIIGLLATSMKGVFEDIKNEVDKF